ncbi:MAG: glycoside hydrolase family 43 protein [Lentisphaeria bacterium]|nr:glycoside hydrolase family 43 protein [Lentisphaeria bacterium]
MNGRDFCGLVLAMLGAGGWLAAEEPLVRRHYCNPLDVLWADPAVLRHEGVYYLTGTSYARLTSRDLVHWRRQGDYFDPAGTWVRGWPWAAELHEWNGRFFFLFCAPGEDSGGRRAICVAAADRPDGVFRAHAIPLWKDKEAWIDPHVFADADGRRYLYVTRDAIGTEGVSEVWVAPLAETMDRLAGPLQLCLRPSQPWEHVVQEGATVLRRGDAYYLMYSSHGFSSPRYSVGYATAPSPVGPWSKSAENPILMRDRGVSGPGHNGVCLSPDGREWFAVYHTHVTRPGGGLRQLALDRLRFLPGKDGIERLHIEGPTRTPQPLPSGAPAAAICLGREEFAAPELDRGRWLTVFNEDASSWRLGPEGLVLRIVPGDIHQDRSDTRNVFLQAAPEGDWDATVGLDAPVDSGTNQAFVVAWQDVQNYVILKAASLARPVFEAAVEVDGVYSATFRDNEQGRDLELRLSRRGRCYRAFARGPDGDWVAVGSPMRADLEDLCIGFGAMAVGQANDGECRVRFFEVDAATEGLLPRPAGGDAVPGETLPPGRGGR